MEKKRNQSKFAHNLGSVNTVDPMQLASAVTLLKSRYQCRKHFLEIAVTTVWLYRFRMPKWLTMVPLGTK